jgi:UDP:flavonoid glycosyltransferase YjiC (YdhE family)
MTGKRIVFCTYGSLGDIYPFFALARELRQRGYAPVIATTPVYRKLVEAQDLPFRPLRPDIDLGDPAFLRQVMDRRDGGRYLLGDLIFPALRDSYEDTAAAAADAGLLVTHPLLLSAFLFARKSGIPWATVALAPISLYSVYDPPVLWGIPFADKLASLGPFWQRCLLKTMALLFEQEWKPFRALEKELGLPLAPNPLFWCPPAHLVLGLFSPLIGAPQPDWPPNTHVTGFPFYDQGKGNPPELQRFLDSGEPPIVFTLGSAAVGVAGDFFRVGAAAAHRLGLRAVLLAGRNLPEGKLPPGILAAPYTPYSAVFPHARLVVFHGGIGTTAEVLRVGRPMLVVPYSHDQPDHAARLVRMGVARRLPRERYTVETAAREIEALLQDRHYADRAATVAAHIRNETGTATACDLLSHLIEARSVNGCSRA